jgi:hypothetical protein
MGLPRLVAPSSMCLTMFDFVMKSPVVVGNSGICLPSLSSVMNVSLTHASCLASTHRGQMSCGTTEGAPATLPQEHLWDREAPSAAWSVLEDGNSHDTSPLARIVTSIATTFASSMLLHAHHEPATSARLGHAGPPGRRGSGALLRWCMSGTG